MFGLWRPLSMFNVSYVTSQLITHMTSCVCVFGVCPARPESPDGDRKKAIGFEENE